MDNCFRENKNRFVISYFSYLIKCGLFKHIHQSFMNVGHTHFDCDAVASKIGGAIKYQNIFTIETLHEKIKIGVKDLVDVEHICGFPDFARLCYKSGFCKGLVG